MTDLVRRKGPKPVPAVDRVLRRVAKPDGDHGCWIWTGTVNESGYGTIRLSTPRRMARVHRVMLEAALGRSIADGEVACHRCDNPPCCNPAHLFVGSQRDNVADAKSKGRLPAGEQHYRSVLSDSDVEAIRRDGRSSRDVAADFGVCDRYVRRLRSGDVRPNAVPA